MKEKFAELKTQLANKPQRAAAHDCTCEERVAQLEEDRDEQSKWMMQFAFGMAALCDFVEEKLGPIPEPKI